MTAPAPRIDAEIAAVRHTAACADLAVIDRGPSRQVVDHVAEAQRRILALAGLGGAA